MSATQRALLLAGLVLLAYANSLQGSFHYDDFHSLLNNPHLRRLGEIPRFFADPGSFSADPEKAMYRPVLLVSYALNYAAGQYGPLGYHLVNRALHLGCALLVWRVGLQAGANPTGAWAAALLFGLHPLATEPVNYISSRSESLAALWYLASLSLFLGRWPGWALLCFGLGLGSKEMAITLPAALWLAEQALGRNRGAWREHLPFWGLGLAYVVLLWSFGLVGGGGGADPGPRDLWAQFWTQAKAGAYYLKLVAMPVGLNVEHAFSEAAGPGHPAVGLALLLLGSLVWLAWRSRRQAGVLWLALALLALLPAVVVPLNVLVNEHRLYLSLAFLAVAVGRSWDPLRRYQGYGVVLVVLCAALVVQRNREWRDELSLWGSAAQHSPAMPRVHAHLGEALRRMGDLEGAQREYETTLRLDPRHRAARTNLGNLHYERAQTQSDTAAARREYALAAAEYEQVIQLDPDYREALNNLGSIYLVLGRTAEASQVYQRVVALSPNFPEAHYNLGLALVRQGRYPEAVAAYQQALRLHPDAETWCSLGEVRLLQGQEAQRQGAPDGGRQQWQEAIACYQQALALDPANTRAATRLRQLGGGR
ncbi:MAG: tetratricopeptide repeat protein [Candidatus Latescibacteria bacterium]|nr:tetratricopeptide repeat protein [Candidatus Latescibacterota bacterium]